MTINNHFYFIVSGELSVYLVKIKVVSITSELYFHSSLWTIRFSSVFRSGSFLHFRFLNTSNFFVSELNYQVLVCIFLVRM